MVDMLLSRFRHAGPLSPQDEEAIRAAFSRTAPIKRNKDVLTEGQPPNPVTLLLEGMTCRYRLLSGGRRQITALVLPGEICNLSSLLLSRVDYSVAAVTDGRIATADRQALLDLVATRPALARALWWSTMVDEAVLREWSVGLGRRAAHQRVAHFLCEIMERFRGIGLAGEGSCPLPLTQESLGDLVGLTVVHVNRVIQDFRASGLIELSRRTLTIRDWDRLAHLGEFSAGYLHQNDTVIARS